MSDTTNAGQQQQAAPGAEQQGQQQGEPNGGQQQRTPSPADLAGQQRPGQQQGEQQGQDNGRNPDMTGWPQAAIDAWKARDEAANRFHAEAQGNRVNAKAEAAKQAQADTLQTIAKALGIVQGDAAPTVESLTADLQKATSSGETITAERDEARKEAAFVRALVAKGLTADLDYATYLANRNEAWRGVSPDADDFAATLAATVESLSADPKIVTSPAAKRSGAEAYSGASGSELTLETFAKMNQSERTKLSREQPEEYRRLSDAEWEAARGR